MVELGCVFWQRLDGERVFGLDGFKSELADRKAGCSRRVRRFYCESWLRTEQVVELLEVSDEVAARLVWLYAQSTGA